MKFISIIGYSGSGKTFFIEHAIKLLKERLSLRSGVFKNVYMHSVDIEGKDSHRFLVSGAKFALIKNKFNNHALFFNSSIDFNRLIEWLEKGPFDFDILFIEGFRNLKIPSILCVKNEEDIETQISSEVKLISGIITKNEDYSKKYVEIPIIEIEKNFKIFIEKFGIE
jgi:molybdopterin-guanine dinucleotide biosynthesis protein MobB